MDSRTEIVGRIVGDTYREYPNSNPDVILYLRTERGKETFIIPSNVTPHCFVRLRDAPIARAILDSSGLGKFSYTPVDPMEQATLAEQQGEILVLVENYSPGAIGRGRRRLEAKWQCPTCLGIEYNRTCPKCRGKVTIQFEMLKGVKTEVYACEKCSKATKDGATLVTYTECVIECTRDRSIMVDKTVVEAFEADITYTKVWKKVNHIRNKVKLTKIVEVDTQWVSVRDFWRAEPYEGQVPDMRKVYYDLEIDDSKGRPKPEKSRIICAALVGSGLDKKICSDNENDMLTEIDYHLKKDVDLLIGWNSEKFDDDFLEERIPKSGREYDKWSFQRVDMLKLMAFKAERRMESLKLPDVVQKILVEEAKGKPYAYPETIERLPSYSQAFKENRERLKAVNFSHAKALKDIDEALDSVNMRIEMGDFAGVQVPDTYFYSRVIDAIALRVFYDSQPRLVARCRRENTGDETYRGAIVLEPTPGQYDSVLHYDLVSLYNRIAQAFNISPELWSEVRKFLPETVNPLDPNDIEKLIPLLAKLPEGIFPSKMREIESWRKGLKAEKKKYESNKDSPEFKKANALDRAVKTLLLAFYGQLGEARSRFYIPLMAALVTYAGREIITETANQLRQLGATVLYGDTDSIFCVFADRNLSPEQAETLGKQIQAFLNVHYPRYLRDRWNIPPERAKLIEIGFEEVYDTIFFGEAQKKYAGWAHGASKPEIVGYEKIRSDWCMLARETQDRIINMRLKKVPRDEIKAFVMKVKNDLLDGAVDPKKLMISKGMTKKASEYKVIPPHVRAAMQLESGDEEMRIRYYITKATGDTISEVKPIKEGEQPPKTDLSARIYYWTHQCFPPTQRVLWGLFTDNEMEQMKQCKASPLETWMT